MNDVPLVSVLIPCYNHEAFLPDILNSLIAQTYSNIELLICDDCSPDRSFAVIQEFEEKLRSRFPCVEILRNEVNCGVTANINRMLRLAKGEFIKVIASDDAMAPDAIGDMVAYFLAHPETDVVIVNGQKVSEDQHYPHFESKNLIYQQPPVLSGDDLFRRIAAHNEIFAPGAMLRASVFTCFGLYDESLAVEDLEFWLRLLRSGQVRFGYVQTPLIYYRINGGSMTSMEVNATLEKRRARFHNAILQTYEVYRDDFANDDFAFLSLTRILDEMSFAIDRKMDHWVRQLQAQLKAFSPRKELSLKNRFLLLRRYVRMQLRKITKRR